MRRKAQLPLTFLLIVNFYEHQKIAIENLRPGSILCGGVGSGKSRTAIGYFVEKITENFKKPRDLYIITTAKKRDSNEWVQECLPFGLDVDRSKSKCEIKVVIDSWNNIKKYVDVRDTFFIFDEQRLCGYGAWVKNFLKISNKNQWILLSATPGDTWMDYMPVFIANGYYENKSDFIRQHVIYSSWTKFPKVERYVNCGKLERIRRELLVNMYCQRETKQHHIYIPCSYDEDEYYGVSNYRWDSIKNEPIENAGALCYALRRVVNSSSERCDKLIDIIRQKKKVIVFYNFDYELEMMEKALDEAVIEYTQWNGHKHEQILHDKGIWAYLVQYASGNEGWNCIETDTMIFFSQNYSFKVETQAAGRIDRLNTPFKDLWYYHFTSKSEIDETIKRCINRKEVFNEKAFVQMPNKLSV